jgi:hypothetical protein
MVSANRDDRLLKLINQQILADGSVLFKIEQFSNEGVVRYFEIDDQEVAEPRLNLIKETKNCWVSMQPNPLRWYSNSHRGAFGEIDASNRRHGRCITINTNRSIGIGFY